MTTFRNVMLGACLALPLAAFAGSAQADDGRTIYVAPGAMVVIVPGPGVVAAPNVVNAGMPDATPMIQMIAQQQAMMQRMVADMNAMFPPMPDPVAMLRAAMGTGVPLNVAVTPLAGGHGVCSQSISIVNRGDGSAPIVHVSQSGDACGSLGVSKPQGVNEVPAPVEPAIPSHGPKVLEIGYPPHPVTNGTPPRT
jgi:hypothetical protein